MESELPNFSLNLDFGNFENETPNKRVKKMSEEDLDKSVEDQKSINTSRSTQFALRTWQTWLEQSEFVEAEKKPIEVYTKQELSRLLKHFYWEIRTAKGDEFEPSSLKTIQRGLDRYLQQKNTGFSIIRDEDFANANKALDAKVKFLKKSGKGNKPNAAQPLSAEMIEEMWQKKVLENTTVKHSPMPISWILASTSGSVVARSITSWSLVISKSSLQVPQSTLSGQWND